MIFVIPTGVERKIRGRTVITAWFMAVAFLSVLLWFGGISNAHAQLPPLPSPGGIIAPTIDFVCDTENDVSGVTGITFPTPNCDGDDDSGDPDDGDGGGDGDGGDGDNPPGDGGGDEGDEGGDDGEDGDETDEGSGGNPGSSSGGGSSSGSGGGGSSSGGGGGGGIINTFDPTRSRTQQGPVSLTPALICEPYITESLLFGENNNPEAVRKLQQFLRDEEGFTNLVVRDVFDEATRTAVNAFQRRYAADILSPWGLVEETGYVYITTRKKINEIHCNNQRSFALTAQEQAEIDAYRAQRTVPLPQNTAAPLERVGRGVDEVVLAEAGENENSEEAPNPDSQIASVGAAESSLGRLLRNIGGFVGSIFDSVF